MKVRARNPSFLVHPIAFGVYPVLALWAHNVEETRPADTIRSFLVALALVLVLLVVLRAIFRSWAQAALLTSLTALLAFSYGHVYAALKQVPLDGFTLARHRYLVPAMVAGVAAAVWLVTRRPIGASVTPFLNVTALAALALPVFAIARHAEVVRSSINPVARSPSVAATAGAESSMPDVYYIILDGYARADLMRDEFNLDLSDFLGFLEEQGFYVASRSTSNYSLTRWSLASSLNMTYLNDLVGDDPSASYVGTLNKMIQESAVRRQFEAMGYHSVALATGWSPTEVVESEIFLTPATGTADLARSAAQMNAFEALLARSTVLLAVNDLLSQRDSALASSLEGPFVAHHNFILGQFALLDRLASLPSPKFVFVHIIAPHQPYVFGPNGEQRVSTEAFTLNDDLDPGAGPGEGSLYRDQAAFVTRRIQESLQQIFSQSDPEPIVIIQGDHGARVNMDWTDPSPAIVRQEMSILNVYRVPESCRRLLYPEITPVNSFGVIFQCLQGSDYPRQPDTNYFLAPETVEFRDVTELVHQAVPAP